MMASQEFFKYAPENFTDFIFVVFNAIFDRGEWPKDWALGLINPVHEKGSINVSDNYRKITVMPVVGKVLESISNLRLVHKNIVPDIDDPLQFGRNGYPTTDSIYILHTMITKQKAKSKPLYVLSTLQRPATM